MVLPKIICTSVVRSAHKGESHGGAYIIDLETEEVKQVLDWNDSSINWEGRGGDRGLRGIGIHNANYYIAASNEFFVFNKHLKVIDSFTNKYLKHCHEISIYDHYLFLTSTGFNSILQYDLDSKQFICGYHIKFNYIKRIANGIANFQFVPKVFIFDPKKSCFNRPSQKDTLHINNVFVEHPKIFFSGTGLNRLYYIESNKVKIFGNLPFGTHNARPFNGNILFNDTENNKVVLSNQKGNHIESFDINHYKESSLQNNDLPADHARQGFGRGLAVTEEGLIIGGASPSTISLYRTGCKHAMKVINITMDVRNSIHGLHIL